MGRMIFIIPYILGVLIALGLGRQTWGQEGGSYQEILIDSPVVTLGDLFSNLPDRKAQIVIGQSPSRGEDVVLPGQWLENLAETYQISIPNLAHQQIRLVRASQEIAPQDITAQVYQFIEAQLLAELPQGAWVDIALDQENFSMHIAQDADNSLSVRDFRYDTVTGRFQARVVNPAHGDIHSQMIVRGDVTPMIRLPVLQRRLQPGEIITAQMIVWDDVILRHELDQDVIITPEDMIGKTVRRVTLPERILRLSDLQAPNLIQQGETISMVYEAGPLTIHARGRALGSGSYGEIIRVMNSNSNQTVEARVSGAGTVHLSQQDSSYPTENRENLLLGSVR